MAEEFQDIEVRNPRSSRFWLDHLRWMLDNEPQYTLELFRQKGLEKYLTQKVGQAQLAMVHLRERGVPRYKAEEMVYLNIVAPPDGPALMSDNLPELLPDHLELKILDWAMSEEEE
jgi:hypothetical protein